MKCLFIFKFCLILFNLVFSCSIILCSWFIWVLMMCISKLLIFVGIVFLVFLKVFLFNKNFRICFWMIMFWDFVDLRWFICLLFVLLFCFLVLINGILDNSDWVEVVEKFSFDIWLSEMLIICLLVIMVEIFCVNLFV